MARVPLYKAVEAELIRRIESGAWEVGRRLPNEFVLADEFLVSQGTMRRALMSLEAMGYLDRKQGRGTQVSIPAPPASPGVTGTAMTLTGPDGAPLVLEVHRSRVGTRGADPTEADLLGAARLSVLERTLRRDGARAALDEVVVPEALIPALDEDAPVDLAELLSEAGLPPHAIADRLTASVTTMSESVALACDRHAALLILTRTATDAEGRVLARQTLRLVADGLTYFKA